VPPPDISYVLDADPVQARARKPEYPLDFLHANRRTYLQLANLLGGMTVIAAMAVREVTAEVISHAVNKFSYDLVAHGDDRWAIQRQ